MTAPLTATPIAANGNYEQPDDQWILNGFGDNEPAPAKFLNWLFRNFVGITVRAANAYFDAIEVGGGYGDTGLSIDAAGALQTNSTLKADGNIETSSTLKGLSAEIGGGYDAPGLGGATIASDGTVTTNGPITTDKSVTHGDAKGSWVIGALKIALDLDPTVVPLLPSSSDWTIGVATLGGHGWTYISPKSGTSFGARAYKIDVPIGATITKIEGRTLTVTGGNGDGGVDVLLVRSENGATGTIEDTAPLAMPAPTAGTVMAYANTSPGLAATNANTEIWVWIAVNNGTPYSNTAVGFVHLKVEWTFNQPGEFA